MAQKRAIIYVRVSTDEQADKGFSLQHQEERLRNYCELQNIQVVGFYREDFSAKTFERPEFTRLLQRLKKERKLADLLLFLKWDRFSRNAADAYGMISHLNRLGVEPQAIEQPLDLNIPENKIMLAFYLAAPEVENDRRALNTVAGMRRAKKEGRWVGSAPTGYKNARNEKNQPVVVQSEKAPLVRWIFEELSSGISSAEAVRQEAMKRGLSCAKANYYLLIRNPFYCGRIYLPAYKDEPEQVVKGRHEPIISEELFEDVQAVMAGRRRAWPTKQNAREEFPLRGHLICPRCGSKLTGSSSKGNGGKYFYYHCTAKCGERFKAEEANKLFAEKLREITFNGACLKVLEHFAASLYQSGGHTAEQEAQKLRAELQKNRERLTNAQQLLLDGTLEPSDYKEIKSRYEPLVNQLESRLRNLSQDADDLDEMLAYGRRFFKKLDELYREGTLPVKQQLIGSMFPEKLIFENKTYRTIKENPLIPLLCRSGKGSKGAKNKKTGKNAGLSSEAPPVGLEPTTL
ncbi:recombinase family protein [Flavisolibacter sp. BT320]|nr:recombinase family protein [Flavisolibacter longurius]